MPDLVQIVPDHLLEAKHLLRMVMSASKDHEDLSIDSTDVDGIRGVLLEVDSMNMSEKPEVDAADVSAVAMMIAESSGKALSKK